MQLPLPQFTVKTLLLATAFVAIALGGLPVAVKIIRSPDNVELFGAVAVSTSPVWIPIVFGADCAGRRGVLTASIGAFLICEVISIFVTRSFWPAIYS